jgi:hypothetical protein
MCRSWDSYRGPQCVQGVVAGQQCLEGYADVRHGKIDMDKGMIRELISLLRDMMPGWHVCCTARGGGCATALQANSPGGGGNTEGQTQHPFRGIGDGLCIKKLCVL